MNRLEPLAIPLRGLHLIEASAGTGKTYTIATLYLRLLLDGLPVDRVLVVTYTNAATDELRGRVRRRVREALARLEAGDVSKDDVLAGLTEEALQAARVLLGEALTRMDEAAIFTIHGCCQRALQDNAFESGQPFECDFLTDEGALRQAVAEDFWRRRVAPMDEAEAAWVRGNWRTPQKLLLAISDGFARDDLHLLPQRAQALAEEAAALLHQHFGQMCELWAQEGREIVALLETSKALNRKSYTGTVVARAVQAMEDLMGRGGPPSELFDDFDRFTPAVLAQRTNSGKTTPSHAFFDLCERLRALTSGAESLRSAAFLAAARTWCRAELARRKEAARQLFFDDLLSRLAQALEGLRGPDLAARLRERYPVALIDEFQDTDPLQYRIFRGVYAGREDCGLYLIGDPKQAIYAFRGADIFTYMEARRAAAQDGAQHTLATNWRSTRRLVAAVNHLFGRLPRPFVYQDIPFEPVDAAPDADKTPLTLPGGDQAPLQLWTLPVTDDNSDKGVIRRQEAAELAAGACAGRIAALIAAGAAGEARLGDRPLQARDLAVLVRTHREGAQMQAALRRLGVASVTLSQDSVLSCDEAGELDLVLNAVADGAEEGLIRGALATALLGTPVSVLSDLTADEGAWEALLGRFQDYRKRWRTRGFMNAFQALLQGEDIPARLLCGPDGERRLTNLLHLAELLQVAERDHPGPDGLLRWLADRRADPVAGGEEAQLRLESDEALVQIVTMHKSKGLEYPVVFIPFPWTSFPERKDGPVLFHDPLTLRACLDLGSNDRDTHFAWAQQEELAQRLRLMYVAITRARNLCVVCWGRIKGAERSALAYLLHPTPAESEDVAASGPVSALSELDAAGLREELDALAGASGGTIAAMDLPAAAVGPLRRRDGHGCELRAAVLQRPIPRDWRLASYSWLANGAESERPDHDPPLAPTPEEGPGLEPEPAGVVDDIFRFPRGTEAGHFLHAVLEVLDFPSAQGDPLAQTVQRLLARHGIDLIWAPVVCEALTRLLDTPLDGEGLRLRVLTEGDRLNELEFHFPLARLTPAALRRSLSGFHEYAGAADGLAFEAVQGLMKGYIDLVFRHGGRYYLADYKSNHLGDRLADYERPGLRQAVRGHRYDLQYLIYSLALHRYLGRRVPGYDYDRHFGGVYYLFLRGMRPEQGPRCGVWYDRPPRGLIDALDALCALAPANGGGGGME